MHSLFVKKGQFATQNQIFFASTFLMPSHGAQNMNLFRREKTVTETVCRECGMEFTAPERMLRHMIKAHTKSGKGPSCKC